MSQQQYSHPNVPARPASARVGSRCLSRSLVVRGDARSGVPVVVGRWIIRPSWDIWADVRLRPFLDAVVPVTGSE